MCDLSDKGAPTEHGVFVDVDDTHAALAESFDNSIVRNCLPDHLRALLLAEIKTGKLGGASGQCAHEMLRRPAYSAANERGFQGESPDPVRVKNLYVGAFSLWQRVGDDAAEYQRKRKLSSVLFPVRFDNKGERSICGFRR